MDSQWTSLCWGARDPANSLPSPTDRQAGRRSRRLHTSKHRDPATHTTPPRCFQPMEVYVDDEAKLTLHGLQQYYVRLKENEKNRKLLDLLDALEFNQVVIFVRAVSRCR